jgi:hypothetical protein
MVAEGNRRNLKPATAASLTIMISKWENGKSSVGELNKHLLAAALGVAIADRGVDGDPDFDFGSRTG